MPAITKDEAIKKLSDALKVIVTYNQCKYQPDIAVIRMANDALAATEHITDAAATQAAGEEVVIGWITTGDVEYTSEGAEIGDWDVEFDRKLMDTMPEFATPETTYDIYLRRATTAPAAVPTESEAPIVLPMTDATRDVLAERKRQIEQEGWTPEQDDEYADGQLSMAAAMYAMQGDSPNLGAPDDWPWNPNWWKPTNDRRNLVKAGALILADIERIDREHATEAVRADRAAQQKGQTK